MYNHNHISNNNFNNNSNNNFNNNYSNEDIYNQETFYNNSLNNTNSSYYNYYNNSYIVNQYLNFINNYIHTMNNNINYFNDSNTIIRNMTDELNNMHQNLDYYYYNLYRNNNIAYSRDYREYYNNLNLNSDNNQQYNEEETNEDNHEETNEEETNEEETNEDNNESYEYLNIQEEEHYRNLSDENIINIINSNVSFKKFNEIRNPINDVCPISQDDFQNDDDVSIINHCGHIFKKDPLQNWLKQNHSCPSCRYNILTDSNIIKYKIGTNFYYLTLTQFRVFIATNIINAMINNNSSRVSFSLIRR